MHIYGILKDGNDNTICKTEKETDVQISFLYSPTLTYMATGKTSSLTRWTFLGKVMPLLFNKLFFIAYTNTNFKQIYEIRHKLSLQFQRLAFDVKTFYSNTS